jgi:hypothetical protein
MIYEGQRVHGLSDVQGVIVISLIISTAANT